MSNGRVLVTGASIAGCGLAWWLGRHGFDVTVVERAPGFREGGQNVDVRGRGHGLRRRRGAGDRRVQSGRGSGRWANGRDGNPPRRSRGAAA